MREICLISQADREEIAFFLPANKKKEIKSVSLFLPLGLREEKNPFFMPSEQTNIFPPLILAYEGERGG